MIPSPTLSRIVSRSGGCPGLVVRRDSIELRLDPRRRAGSGEGGIRTLEGGNYPLNALAGRRLQPLGHFSVTSHGNNVSGGANRPLKGESRLGMYGAASPRT